MSTDTAVQQPSAHQPKAEENETKTFSLDVSEQELLDEFGVLNQVEYGFGA